MVRGKLHERHGAADFRTTDVENRRVQRQPLRCRQLHRSEKLDAVVALQRDVGKATRVQRIGRNARGHERLGAGCHARHLVRLALADDNAVGEIAAHCFGIAR